MALNYITTNIRISKEMLKTLKLKAAQEDLSIAQLIRQAIERTFIKKQEITEQKFKKDPFFKIIGICHTGIKDGSVHHDRDIYGGRQ